MITLLNEPQVYGTLMNVNLMGELILFFAKRKIRIHLKKN